MSNKTKVPITDPWGTPHCAHKTLCFRVKSIYCHKLFSAREIEENQQLTKSLFAIMEKFIKQYVTIYCIKLIALSITNFLWVKERFYKWRVIIIYCLFNIFHKANYCMQSRKVSLKFETFLYCFFIMQKSLCFMHKFFHYIMKFWSQRSRSIVDIFKFRTLFVNWCNFSNF